MTVIRVFFAFVTFAAILTIAVVVIANTADVDSMADPAPRPGEDDEGWPRVPDEQMRIIDAALPADQMDAKRAQLIEEGVAQ